MELIATSNLVLKSTDILGQSEESRNPFNDHEDHEEGLYVFEESKDYGKSYKIYQCIMGSIRNSPVWLKFPSIKVFVDGSVQSKMVSILIIKKISDSVPERSDLSLVLSKINKALGTELIY